MTNREELRRLLEEARWDGRRYMPVVARLTDALAGAVDSLDRLEGEKARLVEALERLDGEWEMTRDVLARLPEASLPAWQFNLLRDAFIGAREALAPYQPEATA